MALSQTVPHLVDVLYTFPRKIPMRYRVVEQYRRLRVVLEQAATDRLVIPPETPPELETPERSALADQARSEAGGNGAAPSAGAEPLRVTLIGRGHSGTRAFGNVLSEAGVHVARDIERTMDYVGGCDMYEMARIFNQHVARTGELSWDFSRAIEAPIPDRFARLLDRYLEPVERVPGPAAWKLPETTLIFPWLIRLRPDIRYVHWVRDPRDVILGRHLTDDLTKFGAPVAYRGLRWIWNRRARLWRRAVSWKYQHDLIEQSPKPKHWLVVRFEDFVTRPDREIERLSEFLGLPLQPIEARRSAVGRWQKQELPELPLLERQMQRYGYHRA